MKGRPSGPVFKMKRIAIILTALLVFAALIFTGCSKGSSSNYLPSPHEAYYDSDVSFNGNAGQNVQPEQPKDDVLSNRKIIRNAELSVETLEFEDFLSTVTKRVSELGGYIESNSVDSRNYSKGSLRTANTVVRIPAAKLDEFLNDINGLGNVIRREEGLSDVTSQYVDTEARIASLRTEYDTLLELLSQAESLDAIIQLQDRLTSVRYEIESYESRLRSYDELVDFSKVSMSIMEVERETAVEKESFGQEVSRRFSESLSDVGNGFANFAKWFLGEFPRIIVVLALLALPLIIVLIIIRSVKKRNAKRREKAMAQYTAPANTENK